VRRWLLGVLATFGVTAAIAVRLLTLAGSGSGYRTVRYPTGNRLTHRAPISSPPDRHTRPQIGRGPGS